MLEKISNFLSKHKRIIYYLLFGVLTTVVNVLSYWICANIFKTETIPSTIIAWILAVTFAYLTNRKWVFGSNATTQKEISKEILSFYACRLGTGLIDLILMVIFVDKLGFNGTLIKFLTDILVIILNYIASKLIVFKTKVIENDSN